MRQRVEMLSKCETVTPGLRSLSARHGVFVLTFAGGERLVCSKAICKPIFVLRKTRSKTAVRVTPTSEMAQRKCKSTQIRDQGPKPDLKMHRRILRFFSKIDNSRQMGPLISYAIKRQHLIIPGPSRFKDRSAKDVHRVQLLEQYDADSFFSEQALKRLQSLGIHLPGPAFLKLMQVLVAIFDVYLATKDSKHRKGQVKTCEESKVTEVSADDNNNLRQCSVPFSGLTEKPINTLSDKNIGKRKFKMYQIKLPPYSEMVESSRKEKGHQETSKNLTKKTKGGSHLSKKSQSREDNSSSSHGRDSAHSGCVIQRTDKNSSKEQFDRTHDKNGLHSRGQKRQCPSPKGDNPVKSNKRRRTSCQNTERDDTVMDKCARLRVWPEVYNSYLNDKITLT